MPYLLALLVAALLLPFFWYVLSHPSYYVRNLRRLTPKGWRAEVTVGRQDKGPVQVWYTENGVTWINEQTLQEASHNWAGGEVIASYLNEAVRRQALADALTRLQASE